jgi:hypothetical protein
VPEQPHEAPNRPDADQSCGDPLEQLGRLLGELSGLAERSAERIERELSNAHGVGRMAITFGGAEARRRLSRLFMPNRQRPASPGPGEAPRPAGSSTRSSAEASAAIDSVIAGYDDLSASQVITLLGELDDAGLRAVATHEAAHRGRRTILNRVEQLLGRSQGRS